MSRRKSQPLRSCFHGFSPARNGGMAWFMARIRIIRQHLAARSVYECIRGWQVLHALCCMLHVTLRTEYSDNFSLDIIANIICLPIAGCMWNGWLEKKWGKPKRTFQFCTNTFASKIDNQAGKMLSWIFYT